jgi:hypothetical protein
LFYCQGAGTFIVYNRRFIKGKEKIIMESMDIKSDVSKGESIFNCQEFKRFMINRLDKAFTADNEYKKLLNECDEKYKKNDIAAYSDEAFALQALAEEIAYIQGWKDAMSMITRN